MARKPTQAQLFAELQARYGPETANAFMAAVRDIKRAADVRRVIQALAAGDIEAAIQATNLDPAVYGPMQDAIAQAFRAGGQATAESMPVLRDETGARMVFRFDGRNLRVEELLREHSAALVTNIDDDARQGLRLAATAGMERGDNPTTTALNMVGRINRVTGQREGGIIGLTVPQVEFVENARAQLASGDPKAMRAYLERGRRDKRFDRSVTKAIREGKPVPKEIADKAITAYSNQLLKLRGDTLGLNETFTALESSKREAYAQAIESGKVTAQAVTKKWRHLSSENPRVDHVAMAGRVVPFDQPFVLPDGTMMQHPHDPSAPVRHVAGCKCQCDYRITAMRSVGLGV